MLNVSNGKISPTQILLPVSVLAFVVFLLMFFQFTQILRDRDAVHTALQNQEKPFADALKLQGQLNALAIGTKKMADGGDKDAQGIIQRLDKMGIRVNADAPGIPPAGPQGRAPMGAAPQRLPMAPPQPPG